MKQVEWLILSVLLIIISFIACMQKHYKLEAIAQFNNASMVSKCLLYADRWKAIDYPCLSGVNQMRDYYKKVN